MRQREQEKGAHSCKYGEERTRREIENLPPQNSELHDTAATYKRFKSMSRLSEEEIIWLERRNELQ